MADDIRALRLQLKQKEEAIPGIEDRVIQLISQAASLRGRIFKIECHEAKEK